MKSIEAQLNEALEQIKRQDAEIASLKKAVHGRQITIARNYREALLKEVNLSQDSIKRLMGAFATSTDNAGLKQAINVEQRRGAR